MDQLNLPLKCHELIVEVACNPITELYAEGKCEKCPETDLESLADCDSIIYIYYRRQRGGNYYKKEQLIVKEVFVTAAEMKDNTKDIKMHYFCKRTQSNKYKKQINELKDGVAIIHVDYSENYKNKQHNEINLLIMVKGDFYSLQFASTWKKTTRLHVKAMH